MGIMGASSAYEAQDGAHLKKPVAMKPAQEAAFHVTAKAGHNL